MISFYKRKAIYKHFRFLLRPVVAGLPERTGATVDIIRPLSTTTYMLMIFYER